MEVFNLKIVLILTVGFAFASVLGYLSFKAKLSPILGYLIAGYLIGPYSPGFVADLHVAEQLAEIGVILMMFSVGLHFKLQDLINVKNIAITGAIGQTLLSSVAGCLLVVSMGWPWQSGIVMGLSIGVASTVVLVRVLSDFRILHTPDGHIAVGWLLVEDIITVFALLFIPALAAGMNGTPLALPELFQQIAWMFLKFAGLILFMFTIGKKIIAYILAKVMETESHELFTLAILAMTFIIAVGSSILLGTSIALGAFIAGILMGQTTARRQVSTNAMPLKDAFVVIFFLSVGMLFNPSVIIQQGFLFLGVLAIILVVKPLAAFLITLIMRYPLKTAVTVSLALAQIGEFSFILSEEAMKYNIFPDIGYDVIVACSLVSLSINPLLFKVKNG